MDSRLDALVRNVESGAAGPPLRILVAGGAFHGRMVTGAEFHSATSRSLVTAATNAQRGVFKRLRRAERELAPAEIEANVERLLQPLAAQPDSERAVSLAPVKWWSYDNKTTLEMPAVRIPYAAISGWWISGETGEQASEWWIGVFFPLPTGN